MDQAQAIVNANEWLLSQGLGTSDFAVREFEQGWLLEPKQPAPEDGQPRVGALRLVIDKANGEVHSFPASEPPENTIRRFLEG